jgi:hypothetical protein
MIKVRDMKKSELVDRMRETLSEFESLLATLDNTRR